LTLDAPVSGGDIGAKNRALTIMAGGDQAAFEQVAPIFDKISKKAQYFDLQVAVNMLKWPIRLELLAP
jgi:3-hydroxyisobutyrate dehydrogenase